ncbi:uncharacterized protein MYCFIDRAFT_177858 [Pseudocercospora fijiensis CIRAD86]|uniref:Uncharacterized protein n=1 Tax=Pseudocercospora fijiensis (strain CIRAD86) TaxID=383855 RepID=M2YNE0_PSEFD|nr:uncharacterized protein MYCFIDRAFT_177858 [Pseudocercospora fijiensis CIRAD86]EME79220.1 hypothetical protein MYCFIDRAFT_177858 [Pseudocercospora fijiensis CIRAD86]
MELENSSQQRKRLGLAVVACGGGGPRWRCRDVVIWKRSGLMQVRSIILIWRNGMLTHLHLKRSSHSKLSTNARGARLTRLTFRFFRLVSHTSFTTKAAQGQ